MDSERCEDTSSILGYGLDVKPIRMVASPLTGPRHTIDNILGIVRKEDGGDVMERPQTPGNGESAGKWLTITYFPRCFLKYTHFQKSCISR